jgi:hypothetical protein
MERVQPYRYRPVSPRSSAGLSTQQCRSRTQRQGQAKQGALGAMHELQLADPDLCSITSHAPATGPPTPSPRDGSIRGSAWRP